MSSLSGAQRMVAPVASTAVITMLAISQNPDRVSNILRSSTAVTRVSGMPRWTTGRAARVSLASGTTTAVLMLLLLLAGCRR